MTKYIFVTGGVVSGLGKGITAASLGMMLKAKGYRVVAQKLDPYLNIDPANINPQQHGEVFITEDGHEGDLDLGHYERFIDENLNQYSNITSGKIYWNVLNNERSGVYSGETVQVIPHITNEIKKFIYAVGKKVQADVVISEIGGTAGDIEGLPFLEAARQVSNEVGRDNCLCLHVTLAPYIKSTGELKTKPTQHSARTLQGLGLAPNIIVVRTNQPLTNDIKEKISLYCSVEKDCVVANRNVALLYDVPLMLEESDLTKIVSRELGLSEKEPDLTAWKAMLARAAKRRGSVKIGLVGRYIKMYDAYLSVSEALTHAGIDNGVNIDLIRIDSQEITHTNAAEKLREIDGVIIPGGFGDQCDEGMIQSARYCRENDVPFFGLCLGLHIMAIEFARNVLELKDANSREFDPQSKNKVIDIADPADASDSGGMRVGGYPCVINKNSKLYKTYKKTEITERHKHRYGINPEYRESFEKSGFIISGLSPDGRLIETAEIPSGRFYVGVQFHPEFKSRPHKPHPLFSEFIKEAVKTRDSKR